MKKIPKKITKSINELLILVDQVFGEKAKRVILYGSYARGDFNRSSDIDVMILTDLNEKEIEEFRNVIWEKCADIEIDEGIVISPLIRNIDEFYSWSDVKPFYINILKEGVVLHGEKD